MGSEAQKVYVAIGNDVQEGLATLEWTLTRWSSTKITIVILHVDVNKNYVYTYYGKLPSSYMNDEGIDFLNKCQRGKTNKILNRYIAFCGKVKTETLNIEKDGEPIHKRIVHLVSSLRIRKLVIGIAFLNLSSSRKHGSPIEKLNHIQQKKPDFCELYLISGGNLIFLKDEFIEDDQGVMIAKLNKKRAGFKGWIGKMLPENVNGHRSSPSSSSGSADLRSQWEKFAEEIEDYFNGFSDSNADEEELEAGEDSNVIILKNSGFMEPNLPKDLNPARRTEFVRIKIGESRDAVRLNRREAEESARRCSKAEWAVTLCTSRAEDLEARLDEEIKKRADLENELNTIREQLIESRSRVELSKSRLESTLENQKDLSIKLRSSTLAKSQTEERLGTMIPKRTGMVQEIETLRKQKDVLQRRIEFCRDKDAIETATRLNDLSFCYKEFTADEIRIGTQHFSDRHRIKRSGDFTDVYRARINHVTVAVKMYNFGIEMRVNVLRRVRHPHLVAVIGFCTELKCVVFEYMHESCLRSALFSNSSGKRALNWHDRVRIAAEVGSGLSFLHLAEPGPMVHGNVSPGKVLLGRNNVAKLHGFRLDFAYDGSEIGSDVRDFGNLVMQLLTGRDGCGFLDELTVVNEASVMEVLDRRAGNWPLEVAVELARMAIRCISANEGLAVVMEEMEEVRKKADRLAAGGGCPAATGFRVDLDEENVVPSFFFCPILKDIMKNPHVASDGFSYELDAIEKWLGMGRDTSPMTNLDLEHKGLTLNHTLRSLIQDWHNKRSIPL